MSLLSHLGAVVKQLREELNYSQEGLAYRANLNRTYVGEVERGIAMPSLATIEKIAKALNITASELISLSEVHAYQSLKTKPTANTVE